MLGQIWVLLLIASLSVKFARDNRSHTSCVAKLRATFIISVGFIKEAENMVTFKVEIDNYNGV